MMLLQPIGEFGRRIIYWAAKVPGNIVASPVFILGVDLLQPMYEVFFTAILSLTVLFWGLDALLILLAYMLHNLRGFLVMSIFTPVLNMFVGEGGTLVGVIRGSFLVAVMLLGLTYIARTFFQFKIVDPQKLFLWGGLTVIFVGTGAAAPLYQGLEALREGMSGYLYGAIFEQFGSEAGLEQISDAFNAPGAPRPRRYGYAERGGIAPIVGYPSLDPGDPNIRGYNIAGAFIRASMEDVLNPLESLLPTQYERVQSGTSFAAVYWQGQSPGELSRLEDQYRGPMVSSVIEGLIRMVFGIIPGILGILESVILLCLTIATGIIFVTLPVAFIFAFFEPLSPMATGMIKQYTNIFMKTMVINVLFALVLLLVVAAAYVGNPIVLLAGTVLGIFFGFNFAQDGAGSIVDSANAFTSGAAQAVGMRQRFDLGSAGTGLLKRGAKAAKSTAEAAGRGALGWMSTGDARYGLGAMLGANRAAYTLANIGEATGVLGRRQGPGMQSFLRGMRGTGMTGGKPFSPASLLQTYQTRQMTHAEEAGGRYKTAFEQYERQVWAQRATYQETGKAEDEPEIDRKAREWAAWQKSPRYDKQGRPVQKVKGKDGQPDRDELIGPPELPAHLQQLKEEAQFEVDRPFMGGTMGRGFASLIPRPTTKGFPGMGDLFPGGAVGGAPVEGLPGGPGAPSVPGAPPTVPGAPGQPPPGRVGPMGGRMLGHVSTLDIQEAQEALQADFALSPGTDGQVEAIPMADIVLPAAVPADQLISSGEDPRPFLEQGYSLMQPDKDHYLYWQQEKDVDPGMRAVQSLSRQAREAVQRQEAAGLPPGAVAPGAAEAPRPRPIRPPRLAEDAPAIPGTARPSAVDLPTPDSRVADCVPLGHNLAPVVRQAFRSVKPGAAPAHPAPGVALADTSGLTEEMLAQLPPEEVAAHPERVQNLPAHVSGSLADMRRAGLREGAMAQVVFDEGKVRPEFTQAMWEQAEHSRRERGPHDAQIAEFVGKSPEVEREFLLTEMMGDLAHHPEADIVHAARAGYAASLEGESPVTQILAAAPPSTAPPLTAPESLTVGGLAAGVYQASAAMQVAVGQPREEAIQGLEQSVGISAGDVYEAMQRHDPREAISVVRTVEGITQDLEAGGMDLATLTHTVYQPDGSGIRPEFLDAVVSRAEGGASSFMGSAEGTQDLQLLVAAGLGMEKVVPEAAIAQAVACSATAPGAAGAGAVDVAQRLYIPEAALENATAPIQSFVEAAHTYELEQEDIVGLVQEAHGRMPDPAERQALEERVQASLRKKLAEPGVDSTLRMMRGQASSIPERIRAPRTVQPKGGKHGS